MTETKKRPLSIVKRNDLTPLCCHCSRELTEVYSKSVGGGFITGRDTVYFCPHCSKVLGCAQSRMI